MIIQKVYKTCHGQKGPKICTCCRVTYWEAKIHLYHSSKLAKDGPGCKDIPKELGIQIFKNER